MQDAVDRGLERRNEQAVPRIGIDEKSFGRGQDYILVMTDIDQARKKVSGTGQGKRCQVPFFPLVKLPAF